MEAGRARGARMGRVWGSRWVGAPPAPPREHRGEGVEERAERWRARPPRATPPAASPDLRCHRPTAETLHVRRTRLTLCIYQAMYVSRYVGSQIPRATQAASPMTEPTASPLSYNGALVLQALTQGFAYGFEIMRAAHLPSGTVYPLLRRLEADGMLESSWEDAEDAHAEGRPPRRYYRATQVGRAALVEARKRLRAQRALFEGEEALEEGAG